MALATNETAAPSTAEALAGGVAVLPPLEGVSTRLSHAGTFTSPSRDNNHTAPDMPRRLTTSTAKSAEAGKIAGSGADEVYQPPPPPLSVSKRILIGSIVTLSMCVNSGSGMGLTISLPAIQTELDMQEADLQWVTSVYALTAGGFLLLSGRLSDVYGRKLVFCAGLIWTAVWTLIGGFMKNGAALIITRALAGCGQAMSTPSAIGIIATNFSGQARSTAFAAFSAGAPIGAAFGMVIGGLLTAYSPHTWRAFLWTIAALSFAIGIIAIIWTPRDTLNVIDKRVDWIGAALVTIGLIFIMFAVSDGTTAPNGWATSYIIALLILGVLFVVTFFLWESYLQRKTTRPPLMRLQLWTRSKGRLASVYFIGSITWMCFQSLFYHATLFYQQVQMTGPIGATLRFLPCSVSGILCNVLVALLVGRVRTQWIICTGILSTGLASIWFALSDKDVLYWRLPFQGMWMAVLGADFLMATGSIFVAALANPEEQSVAGAVFQTMIQLGGAFGLAFTTVINTSYHERSLNAGVPPVDAQLNGLHAAFWLGAAFAGLALLLALVMLRGMGTIGKGKKVKQVDSTLSTAESEQSQAAEGTNVALLGREGEALELQAAEKGRDDEADVAARGDKAV